MQRTAPIGSDENHSIPPGEMRLDGCFFSGSAPVAAGQEVRRPRRGPACGSVEELGAEVTALLEKSFLKVIGGRRAGGAK